MGEGVFNSVTIYWISCRKVWVISSFFAVCHGLNDKGLHDVEKRMILSNYWGGGCPGCYGPVRMCTWRGNI